MTAPTLSAITREKAHHELDTRRLAGQIPAVLYGNKKAPTLYWVQYLDFEKVYRSAGESTILDLMTEGAKARNVLIHDVARDPVTGRFTHIDFYEVNMSEEIEADVPLEFMGEAPAVKELSGILVRSLDEISIKCLPKDLPHSLSVNLSILKTFEDQIKVKDIVLPKGVELDEDGETIVATVDRPRTEAEMAALDEKVEMDVTKVEGVVKEAAPAEGAAPDTEKSGNKEEKKPPKTE